MTPLRANQLVDQDVGSATSALNAAIAAGDSSTLSSAQNYVLQGYRLIGRQRFTLSGSYSPTAGHDISTWLSSERAAAVELTVRPTPAALPPAGEAQERPVISKLRPRRSPRRSPSQSGPGARVEALAVAAEPQAATRASGRMARQMAELAGLGPILAQASSLRTAGSAQLAVVERPALSRAVGRMALPGQSATAVLVPT